MDGIGRDPLSQLAWVAYLAEQLGWTDLADRISEDVAAAHEKAAGTGEQQAVSQRIRAWRGESVRRPDDA
ncbi:MAG TPA: hypothetical protein V6D22_16145 [Candidatus Obscuribacterales bacterium]